MLGAHAPALHSFMQRYEPRHQDPRWPGHSDLMEKVLTRCLAVDRATPPDVSRLGRRTIARFYRNYDWSNSPQIPDQRRTPHEPRTHYSTDPKPESPRPPAYPGCMNFAIPVPLNSSEPPSTLPTTTFSSARPPPPPRPNALYIPDTHHVPTTDDTLDMLSKLNGDELLAAVHTAIETRQRERHHGLSVTLFAACAHVLNGARPNTPRRTADAETQTSRHQYDPIDDAPRWPPWATH